MAATTLVHKIKISPIFVYVQKLCFNYIYNIYFVCINVTRKSKVQ